MDFGKQDTTYQGAWDSGFGGSDNSGAVSAGVIGGNHNNSSSGKFWNGILDGKDVALLPGNAASSMESNSLFGLDLIKRRIITFGLLVWQFVRPDIPGTNTATYRDVRKFRLFLLSIGGCAMFFWIWAIYNTIHMTTGQDLGMYSFGTVIITSFVGLFKAKPKNNGSFDKRICIAMTASHILVALNYLLGVVFAFSIGTVIYWRFGTYCITFCILWGYAAYQGWKLGISVVDLMDSSAEDVEEERLIF